MIAQKPTLAAPAIPLRPRLWARMLSMLTAQLPLILRVVAIAMTLTTDGASGCDSERLPVISLIHERLADRVPLRLASGPEWPGARGPAAGCLLCSQTVVVR